MSKLQQVRVSESGELAFRPQEGDVFLGKYRGYLIEIKRRRDMRGKLMDFYVQVWNDNGSAYDGAWGTGKESMPDAVIEALKGSMLLERNRK